MTYIITYLHETNTFSHHITRTQHIFFYRISTPFYYIHVYEQRKIKLINNYENYEKRNQNNWENFIFQLKENCIEKKSYNTVRNYSLSLIQFIMCIAKN